MALGQNAPATDSAAELNKIIGADSTATFENDPKFIHSDPTANGSSENLNAAKADPEEDDIDEEEDEDGEFDEDDGENDEEEVDEEDAGTDEEDEDDEEDEYDDDEDGEDEDDAEEVAASSSLTSETLHADGLLGYEDEADDVREGVTEKQGNAERVKKEAALKDGEDDDAGDDGREAAIDEDKLNEEETIDLDGDESSLDTDETATLRKGLVMMAAHSSAAGEGMRA